MNTSASRVRFRCSVATAKRGQRSLRHRPAVSTPSSVLLTATTLLGVLTAVRWRSDRWPRFAVATLHRNLTLLALVFIGVHVATTIADGYAPIGVEDVFLPFTSQYRPVWLGLGALAFDLLVALTITSLLRRHIGFRTWRALHWAAYGTWP